MESFFIEKLYSNKLSWKTNKKYRKAYVHHIWGIRANFFCLKRTHTKKQTKKIQIFTGKRLAMQQKSEDRSKKFTETINTNCQ